jgi:DNA-binding NarL/FixJ family response regulator
LEAATNLRKSINVLIVDDHRLFAQALEATLATDERIEVVGHAEDGAQAGGVAGSLDPDVILMDIQMPGMDGFEATRRIRSHDADACVLMLTGSNSRSDVDRARDAGAAGYVTKDRIAAELIDAIIEVSEKSIP